MLCGISTSFPVLSPCERQVAHALLTRPPLSILFHLQKQAFSKSVKDSARLACVRHAASVHPEPGSNSQIIFLTDSSVLNHLWIFWFLLQIHHRYFTVCFSGLYHLMWLTQIFKLTSYMNVIANLIYNSYSLFNFQCPSATLRSSASQRRSAIVTLWISSVNPFFQKFFKNFLWCDRGQTPVTFLGTWQGTWHSTKDIKTGCSEKIKACTLTVFCSIKKTSQGAVPWLIKIIITTSKLVVWLAPRRGFYRLSPWKGRRSLTPHYHHRQPLTCGCLFCLLVLTTRKRVHILLYTDSITGIIFFELVSYVFFNNFLVLAYCVYVVSSAPEVSASIFVFQVCVSVEYHQTAFPFQISHKLRYT